MWGALGRAVWSLSTLIFVWLHNDMKQNNLFSTTFLYWIFGTMCNCTLFSKGFGLVPVGSHGELGY